MRTDTGPTFCPPSHFLPILGQRIRMCSGLSEYTFSPPPPHHIPFNIVNFCHINIFAFDEWNEGGRSYPKLVSRFSFLPFCTKEKGLFLHQCNHFMVHFFFFFFLSSLPSFGDGRGNDAVIATHPIWQEERRWFFQIKSVSRLFELIRISVPSKEVDLVIWQ
jgi:hypothetical protein